MNWIVSESVLFRPQHWGWTVTALITIVIVGIADYVTGPQITFSVFYLVPVSVAAWLGGTAGALAGSVLAAVVWFGALLAASASVSNTFVYVWNFCAQLFFLLLVALLLGQLRRMLDRERELSRRDQLTGLPNARALHEIAGAEIARAGRYRLPLSLAFIDVDDFKRINDSRGHGAGDRLLRLMAQVIRGSLRSSDHVARCGGDEFVVLLPVADQDAAHDSEPGDDQGKLAGHSEHRCRNLRTRQCGRYGRRDAGSRRPADVRGEVQREERCSPGNVRPAQRLSGAVKRSRRALCVDHDCR